VTRFYHHIEETQSSYPETALAAVLGGGDAAWSVIFGWVLKVFEAFRV
jgi:hypothetical protein